MKFTYEYRTSDNVRHEGVVVAADREAAFQQLKAQGIKPGRLVEVPGFFNHLFGKGKRWITIGVLGALLAIALAAWVGADRRAARAIDEARSTSHEARFLTDTTRRQIIGDTAVIEKGILDGWADVFDNEGERFLAGFAIPGVPVKVRTTSVEALEAVLFPDRSANHAPQSTRHEAQGTKHEAQGTKHEARPPSLEARQIIAMVEGMKQELRQFLADGGTVVEYGRRLVQRQEEEIAHYNRAKQEIDALKAADTDPAVLRARWETLNDALRLMGIKLVAWPE